MVALILGYIFVLIIPILVFFKRNNATTFISLLSISSTWFFISIGKFKFPLDFYIAMVYIISNLNWFLKDKSLLKRFLFSEYFLMLMVGYFFMFFSPWEDVAKMERTWTQSLPGKTLTNTLRTFEPIATFLFFYYITTTKKIVLPTIIKYISIIIIAQFFIGAFDTFILPGYIKSFFHYEERNVLSNRFTGMFTEPKHYGKAMVFLLFFMLPVQIYLNKAKSKVFILTVFCAITGIMLSFSVSAIAMLGVAGIFFMIFGRVKWYYIAISLFFISSLGYLILNNDYFIEQATVKAAQTIVESGSNVIDGVPDWISGLEVFDSAAAAFFYINPIHLIWGVGPNTICIPASLYVSDYSMLLLDGVLNSPPGTFILYYLSRSGIIGLFLICLMFYKLYKRLNGKNKWLSRILILMLISFFYACNSNYIPFMILGILNFYSESKYIEYEC